MGKILDNGLLLFLIEENCGQLPLDTFVLGTIYKGVILTPKVKFNF